MPGRWGGGPAKWWHGELRGCERRRYIFKSA